MIAARRNAGEAADQPERQDLEPVDAQDVTAAGADALQDRDALDLLLDEDARDARDADAAEDDDDEPDETQVVLRSGQLLAEIVLGAPERPDVDESVAKRVAQRPPERLDARLVNAQHHLVVGAAAERRAGRHPRAPVDRSALAGRD